MSGKLASPGVRAWGRGPRAWRAIRGLTFAFTLFLAGVPVACATGAGSGSSAGAETRRNVITRDELAAIEETEDITVYEAVRRLHPQWLSGRGTVSFRVSATVQVLFNGARIGDVGELRQFRVTDVQYIEHLDGPQATQRFGTGFERGVILVYGRAGS